MFKTIKRGLKVYKEELRKYLVRVGALKKVYGNENWMSWDDEDYDFIIRGAMKLNGMEEALGLSKNEVKRIREEIQSSLQ